MLVPGGGTFGGVVVGPSGLGVGSSVGPSGLGVTGGVVKDVKTDWTSDDLSNLEQDTPALFNIARNVEHVSFCSRTTVVVSNRCT